MDPFLGEIRAFGFDFVPRGWAYCQGQLLPLSQNSALFALLGVTYGGDGRTNFALPDLRGIVPLNQGQGAGLATNYVMGQTGGATSTTLTSSQIGGHTHSLNADRANVGVGAPSGNLFGKSANRLGTLYAPAGNPTLMAVGVITPVGGNQSHSNLQPYLVLNYCIALQGIFPQRQ